MTTKDDLAEQFWQEHRPRWFGKSWGAPVCEPKDRCAVPSGATCSRCREIIAEDAQGVTLAHVRDGRVTGRTIFHLDCYLQGILPCKGCKGCKPARAWN